jgi:hypothetical protein
MEVLDRYLYQVGRHLPRKDKEDTLNELRSLILEEFDVKVAKGEAEEKALLDTIKGHGDPYTVAFKYRTDNPLIRRELEFVMWMVIRIIAIVIPLGILIAKTVEFITSNDSFTSLELMLMWAYNIPSLLTILIATSGMVFFVFLLIERTAGDSVSMPLFEFDPEKLPPTPKKIYKVSVFESIVMILGSVALLYVLNFNQGLIGIYYDGDTYPLLNSNFERILPFFSLNILLGLAIAIFHLSKRRKNKLSKTFEFIQEVFGGIILIVFATRNIFTDIIIEGYNLNFLRGGFRVGFIIIGIFAFIGAITKYIKMFLDQD